MDGGGLSESSLDERSKYEFKVITLFKSNAYEISISIQGWLKCRETVTEGFDKLPEAFVSMLQGGNTGKAVVKVN